MGQLYQRKLNTGSNIFYKTSFQRFARHTSSKAGLDPELIDNVSLFPVGNVWWKSTTVPETYWWTLAPIKLAVTIHFREDTTPSR